MKKCKPTDVCPTLYQKRTKFFIFFMETFHIFDNSYYIPVKCCFCEISMCSSFNHSTYGLFTNPLTFLAHLWILHSFSISFVHVMPKTLYNTPAVA